MDKLWQLLPFILTSSSSSSFILLSDDESDPEATELDLGTKIKTPKDVMLEELSLLTNRGSKMFRMRQQRVEKFIVTNENMVRVRKRRGACVCVYAYWSDFIFLLCLPAEPPEPADVPSPCSTKAWDGERRGWGHRYIYISASFQCLSCFLSVNILHLICLSIEGDVVHVYVDVWVVLTADPANGCAVERGAWTDVGLQVGHRLRLLGGTNDLWELEGQHLGCLVMATKWQRRPGEETGKNIRMSCTVQHNNVQLSHFVTRTNDKSTHCIQWSSTNYHKIK